jgi:hypothetical protein
VDAVRNGVKLKIWKLKRNAPLYTRMYETTKACRVRGKVPVIFNLDNMWKLTASLSGIHTHRKSSSVDRIANWAAPKTVTNVVEEKRVIPRRESKSLRSTQTWSS